MKKIYKALLLILINFNLGITKICLNTIYSNDLSKLKKDFKKHMLFYIHDYYKFKGDSKHNNSIKLIRMIG